MAEYVVIKDNSSEHIVDEEYLADALEWYIDRIWDSPYRGPRRVRNINDCGKYVQTSVKYRPIMIHRLLMMYKLRGPIPEKHAVHHINGNPRDNRIENLKIINKADHASMHSKGRKLSEAHKKAIGDSVRGIPRPPEVRAKISAGHMGKIVSQETREKLRQANLGFKHKPRTEEQREDARSKTQKAWDEGRMKGRTGMPHSEETKKKLKEAWVIRREKI